MSCWNKRATASSPVMMTVQSIAVEKPGKLTDVVRRLAGTTKHLKRAQPITDEITVYQRLLKRNRHQHRHSMFYASLSQIERLQKLFLSFECSSTLARLMTQLPSIKQIRDLNLNSNIELPTLSTVLAVRDRVLAEAHLCGEIIERIVGTGRLLLNQIEIAEFPALSVAFLASLSRTRTLFMARQQDLSDSHNILVILCSVVNKNVIEGIYTPCIACECSAKTEFGIDTSNIPSSAEMNTSVLNSTNSIAEKRCKTPNVMYAHGSRSVDNSNATQSHTCQIQINTDTEISNSLHALSNANGNSIAQIQSQVETCDATLEAGGRSIEIERDGTDVVVISERVDRFWLGGKVDSDTSVVTPMDENVGNSGDVDVCEPTRRKYKKKRKMGTINLPDINVAASVDLCTQTRAKKSKRSKVVDDLDEIFGDL
eukprot:CFRG0914T1